LGVTKVTRLNIKLCCALPCRSSIDQQAHKIWLNSKEIAQYLQAINITFTMEMIEKHGLIDHALIKGIFTEV